MKMRKRVRGKVGNRIKLKRREEKRGCEWRSEREREEKWGKE